MLFPYVVSQGMLDLRVWPDRVADGSSPSSTPGKARSHGKEQMQRLSKVLCSWILHILK